MDIALFLVGGLLLLALGGELLVRGAVRVAECLGISPLLIGLTLVGFGTSTPELVTSVQAALRGSPGIAVGNIVGSNIANILLILGVSALLLPIAVSSAALRRDGVLGAVVAAVFCGVGLAWTLDRLVGVVFVAGLGAYLLHAWREESRAQEDHGAAYHKAQAFEEAHRHGLRRAGAPMSQARLRRMLLSAVVALGGLALVLFGGRLLVDGAIALARSLGIAEAVIGLTIVAVGTSMPELVTSVVAAIRRHADVAFGNVLGSNIYNILGIAGVTALIAPTQVPPEIARFDALLMLGASLLLLVVARTGWRIGRREGTALLAGYAAYVWVLWPA
ncbi:calcium/sodium antiporter [Crenalkalicoccus roseus]|uniref:calcium/sodium antiporter n=1 Tax=Crenalkalicoccus roseus TaxID=1485588 RepID=UPI001080AAF6|nr:calcium/sodium antiporter [Crenalkalicoccus roseus]